jgi:hypothetical protein
MSEIIYVLLSAVWIGGLSIILAVVGIGVYLAEENHQPVGKVLNSWGCRLAINLGAALFCAGLAGLTGPVWEKGLWAGLGIGLMAITGWDKIEQLRIKKNRTRGD